MENYLKIAWRSIRSSPIYSFISILGLGLGMSRSLLIGIWAVHEISYDDFYPDKEQIYKVHVTRLFNGKLEKSNLTPAPLADALKEGGK